MISNSCVATVAKTVDETSDVYFPISYELPASYALVECGYVWLHSAREVLYGI